MNVNLREQLKQLRLSGLLQTLEVRLQEAKSSKLDYAEFLELILEDEMMVRRDRQIERRTKAAAFRDQKCLDDFDFEFNKSVKRKQIYDLAAGDFVRKHHDAIFVGPPGVGKSHIVQSIGRQLIRDGYTVYYRSIFDCVRDFLHDEAFEGHDRILNRYLKPDVLILDDMGMKQLPKKSGEFLFEIVMRRHELRSTMMTSNRPLEDWGKLIGDVPSATAILDRFLQSAEVIQITGRSYRLRGRHADKQSTEPAGEEPENELDPESKTGQSKSGQTRAPGRPRKATKKPAN
jgi:DNA replication protein DnaC